MKRREFIAAAAATIAFPVAALSKRPPAPPGRSKPPQNSPQGAGLPLLLVQR